MSKKKAPPPLPIPTPSYAPTMKPYHVVTGFDAERRTTGAAWSRARNKRLTSTSPSRWTWPAAMGLREPVERAASRRRERLSVNDLIVKAVANCATEGPVASTLPSPAEENPHSRSDQHRYSRGPRRRGLLTTVIRDCDKKSLGGDLPATRVVSWFGSRPRGADAARRGHGRRDFHHQQPGACS